MALSLDLLNLHLLSSSKVKMAQSWLNLASLIKTSNQMISKLMRVTEALLQLVILQAILRQVLLKIQQANECFRTEVLCKNMIQNSSINGPNYSETTLVVSTSSQELVKLIRFQIKQNAGVLLKLRAQPLVKSMDTLWLVELVMSIHLVAQISKTRLLNYGQNVKVIQERRIGELQLSKQISMETNYGTEWTVTNGLENRNSQLIDNLKSALLLLSLSSQREKVNLSLSMMKGSAQGTQLLTLLDHNALPILLHHLRKADQLKPDLT